MSLPKSLKLLEKNTHPHTKKTQINKKPPPNKKVPPQAHGLAAMLLERLSPGLTSAPISGQKCSDSDQGNGCSENGFLSDILSAASGLWLQFAQQHPKAQNMASEVI